MRVLVTTDTYKGPAGFSAVGNNAILSHMGNIKTTSIGKTYEINGDHWVVKGIKNSPYVNGMINIYLVKEIV